MAELTFADSHNMVAFFEKSMKNTNFNEIVDFLNANLIRYALTISPTIYVSYIEQFWSTAKIKTVNHETQIHAKVDGKTVVITESTMRRDLHFNEEDGNVTPLFATMLIQSQAMEGKGSGQPTEPQHTPTTASPSHLESLPNVALSSQPKKTKKHRKTKRNATEISQSSGPTTHVADETVHEEREDSMERAATTTASLDAEQDSGNILRTQSMTIPNEPFPQEIGSGDSPRCQETMGDKPAQTRVFDLENVKNAQDLEIQKLKKRVKKLESKKKSRIPPLKRRLFKGSMPVTIAGVSVSTAEPSTPPTTTTPTILIEDEYLTIAQTLMKMKSEKSKAKGITMQEPSESGTRVRASLLQIDPKDKGKANMVEPEKPSKKKDQIKADEEIAKRLAKELQAELEEEARIER
ncbi:hypothetical protein Tco_1505176 [Tanacetum coccineum]